MSSFTGRSVVRGAMSAMATAALAAAMLAPAPAAHGQSSQRLINRLQLERSLDDVTRSARRTERSIADAERSIELRTLRSADRLRWQGEADRLRLRNGFYSRP